LKKEKEEGGFGHPMAEKIKNKNKKGLFMGF
jgi:hypothetical protein